MPSSITFSGSGFSLEAVSQPSLGMVRVRFTQDPVAIAAGGAHDALNPAFYTLTGPSIGVIASVAATVNDSQSVDLTLSGLLPAGTWTLTASSSIWDVDGNPLTAPLSLTFTVSSLGVLPEPVSKGAVSDSPANVLRKHLNPALKGDAWDAIIAGIATGDQKNLDNARLAFDQLFKSTASDIYLARKAADDGLQRPPNIGMPDDLFRSYAIESTNGKLVEGALLKILEVFYGSDSVRAYVDSAVETFYMNEGDDVSVLVDESVLVTTTFHVSDFAIPGAARAIEVAAAFNRSFGANNCHAFAVAVTDPTTATTKVRVYSGSLGLGSSVRVVGGKAQAQLQFPDLVLAFSGLPTWTLSTLPASNTLRFAATSQIDMSQVRIGDYVIIYGPEFNAANRGTWTITNVYWAYPGGVLTQYFDVVNAKGIAQAGLVQLRSDSLMVFRPRRATIANNGVVVASIGEEVDVVLPATSRAVGRGPRRAAYGQVAPSIAITSLERFLGGVVTATTATAHGLSVGSQVIIDGAYGATAIPAVHAGTNASGIGSVDYSKGSVWGNASLHNNAPAQGGVAVRLLDGSVFRGFGYNLTTGTINDNQTHWSHTTITSDTIVAGERQVSYNDLDARATVPQKANWPAASLGLSLKWFYGRVVVTGGDTFSGARTVLNNVQVYSPLLETVVANGSNMNTPRAQHCQVTLPVAGTAYDGGFLVIGGMNSENTTTATVERYSIADGGVWVSRAAMSEPRAQHQAVVLKNGIILVIGGRSGGLLYPAVPADIGRPLSTCELYDPSANTWFQTGYMSVARYGHKAVLLPDGRVLVVGGTGFNPTQPTANPVPLTSAEIWNPTTGQWSPAGTTAWPRDLPIAEYLASRNQVVVTGGTDTVGGTKTELFDVARMKWSIGSATLSSSRGGAVSAVLGNDIIACYGGFNAAGTSTGLTSLYVPNADKFLGGGLNGVKTVASVPTTTTFTYQTDEQQYTLNASAVATATPVAAPTSKIPGPYVFDTKQGVAITGISATTAGALAAGQRYSFIDVDDATKFPDAPGWLVFAFGYKNQVAPVKYLGRLSNTRLSLDYGFVFPASVAQGSNVTLLSQKGPWIPPHPETVGAFYITASPAGRVEAGNAIAAATGAGITINTSITYPGDRGLAGEGLPSHGNYRVSDKVAVWAGDDIDGEIKAARAST